jgi:hypothetical protein
MGILRSRIHSAQSESDGATHCNGILTSHRPDEIVMEQFNTISDIRLGVRFRRSIPPDLRSNSRISSGLEQLLECGAAPSCGLPLPVWRPRDALTALRHGVEPDLICQPSPSPGIKTRSPSIAFPSTLSLPFSSLSCTAPPGRASGRAELHLLSVVPPPLPTETIRRGQWEKCRSVTGWLLFT